MANRRMFSKTVTNSSHFLSLPLSAQALYYHIGMNTDDDGYCERLYVMRLSLCQPSDIQVLIDGLFIHQFNDNILLDLFFDENNQIRKDRKKDSNYTKLYPKSTICQPNDIQMTAQVRLGKVRLGKVKEKNIKKEKTSRRDNIPYEEIINDLNTRAGTSFLATTEATIIHINNSWDYAIKHPTYKDDPLSAFFAVNKLKVDACTEDPSQRTWLKPSVMYRMGPKNNNFENNLNQPKQQTDEEKYGRWGSKIEK